jgi:hypothetical protein
MALSGTTNKQSFTATASQTDFVFTIPFFNATRASDSGTTLKFGDIKVTRQAASGGAITALTPADSPSTVNQFKVTATNGDPAQGATITIGSGATVNDIYVVERDVAYTQDYDLQEGATIDPTALNKAFDRVVAQNQQQSDQFTRTVTFPSTDADTITYNVNDSSANRANKFLGFDSDGDVTTLAAVSGSASVDTGRGLQLVGGQIGLKDDGVTQAFMADDAIGADQLASNSVVSASIVDGSIATGDIADDAVTLAKIQNIATSKVLGRTTASSGIIEELAFLDEDNMASNSATGVASQQSIKAYTDTTVNARAADPLRGYNDLSHSTTSATIIENNTGRPLFVSFGATSTHDIDILLEISSNNDMSSATTIGSMQILPDGSDDSKATVTGIVPAGYYWRFTFQSFQGASFSSKFHRSFQL